MKATKKQRQQVYEKTNGRCWYCGIELKPRWHVDHVKPLRRKSTFVKGKFVSTGESYSPENHNIDNMVPSCPQCNNFKFDGTIEQFRQSIKNQVEAIRQRSAGFRMAEKYGLIEERDIEVKFYFEEMEKE